MLKTRELGYIWFFVFKKRGGDVANPKGNPENLKPVRTKDEARKRGANGGKKSGEARRRKRDVKQSISLLLDMAANGAREEKLAEMGFAEEDRTNMNALIAGMYAKAISGDIAAFKALMDYGGFNPEQKMRDKERKARIKAMNSRNEYFAVEPEDDNQGEDVLIYLPENGRDDDGSS